MVSQKNRSYRWMIFIIVFVSQFVLSIAAFGWGALAPFLKEIMSLNGTQIGLVSSVFYFSSALSALPSGILVDRYGIRKGLFSWLGLTGFPLYLLGFLHGNFSLFLILVAASGFGYGIGNPVASKALIIWFDRKTRGLVFGVKQSAVTIGAAVGGILLIYISKTQGPFTALRILFWIILVLVVLVFFLYRDSKKAVDPETWEHQKHDLAPAELKPDFITVLHDKKLLGLSFSIAMLGMAQGVVAAFFILYLKEKLEYSLAASGFLFAVLTMSGAAGRILWGVVSDRVFHGRRRPVLIIISSLAFGSAIAAACWPKAWPQFLFMAVIIGIGLSSWGWNGLAFLFVAEISDTRTIASSVGLATTLGWLGLSLGPIGFGSIVDNFGYLCAWAWLSVFCLTALILFLLSSE